MPSVRTASHGTTRMYSADVAEPRAVPNCDRHAHDVGPSGRSLVSMGFWQNRSSASMSWMPRQLLRMTTSGLADQEKLVAKARSELSSRLAGLGKFVDDTPLCATLDTRVSRCETRHRSRSRHWSAPKPGSASVGCPACSATSPPVARPLPPMSGADRTSGPGGRTARPARRTAATASRCRLVAPSDMSQGRERRRGRRRPQGAATERLAVGTTEVVHAARRLSGVLPPSEVWPRIVL